MNAGVLYVYPNSINDILNQNLTFEETINSDNILILAIYINSDTFAISSYNERLELYNWLMKIPVITILADKGNSSQKYLEMFLMFDYRLAYQDVVLSKYIEYESFVFDFTKRFRLLFGKKAIYEYKKWISTKKDTPFYKPIISKMEDDIPEQIKKITDYLFGNKSTIQIKSILDCYNLAKTSAALPEEEILKNESYNFCKLIMNR